MLFKKLFKISIKYHYKNIKFYMMTIKVNMVPLSLVTKQIATITIYFVEQKIDRTESGGVWKKQKKQKHYKPFINTKTN